ncbi:MAG: hypothetical protein EOM12_16015, partial [Verrucomicrobiae bacterium]|nr:hypothetical protein [Verrucomicrobiae bacterium]
MSKKNGRGSFSNHWKLFFRFFQSLETFFTFFPIIGNFLNGFSNHWKTGGAVLVFFAMVCSVSMGFGIEWSSVNGYLNYEDGTTPLMGSSTEGAGCFVQLIWVGANATIDDAYNSGDGTSGDDVVVDYAWVGAGSAGGDNGWFDGRQVAEGGDVQDGRDYYLRTWTASASNYGAGEVPTAATNFYGDSTPWTWTKTSPTYDQVDFTSSGDPLDATNPVNVAASSPDVVYVDAAVGSSGAGTNWLTAFKTIQEGVEAVSTTGIVWVTNGVYDAGGAVTPGYALTNRVMIDKPITVQSVNGPEVTFISGAPDTRGGSPSNGAAAIRGVYMGTNASLIGFTITNGYTRELALQSSYGGGIYSDQSSLISNCVVKDCHSYYQGGGINAMGHTLITDCRIENNEQDSVLGTCGGGAYLANGVTMNSCIVSGNVANAASGSGGLYLNSDSYTQVVTVANSLIV